MHTETTGAVEDVEVKPNNDVHVEMRGDVMTVAHGNYVMEFAVPCPPWY